MGIRRRFKSAIQRGTGETHLILKENPQVDFSKYIIEAAFYNLAYDTQCESRVEYIVELINLSPQKDKILNEIYYALEGEIKDEWSVEQLFDVAAHFAKHGDARARRAIYKAFDTLAAETDEVDICGEDAVIEIDGIEGLKHVISAKGKILAENSEQWENSFRVDYFQEQNPSIDVYNELRKAGEVNTSIRKYLEEIEKNKFVREKWKSPEYNYAYIREQIEHNKNVRIPTFARDNLTKAELKLIADDFLAEKDRSKQEKYLRVFAQIKFPYDYKPLLKIVKGQNSKNDRLIEFAVEALTFFSSPHIRSFAVEKLQKTNKPAIYTNLLVGNYKKGDWRLLKSIAEKCKNQDIIHSLAWSYIDIYKANPRKECKEPLEVIYGKLTCGLHRRDIVEILIENNVLSETICKEIEFDSDEDTRELLNIERK